MCQTENAKTEAVILKKRKKAQSAKRTQIRNILHHHFHASSPKERFPGRPQKEPRDLEDRDKQALRVDNGKHSNSGGMRVSPLCRFTSHAYLDSSVVCDIQPLIAANA
jgi:hypothetical protein